MICLMFSADAHHQPVAVAAAASNSAGCVIKMMAPAGPARSSTSASCNMHASIRASLLTSNEADHNHILSCALYIAITLYCSAFFTLIIYTFEYVCSIQKFTLTQIRLVIHHVALFELCMCV